MSPIAPRRLLALALVVGGLALASLASCSDGPSRAAAGGGGAPGPDEARRAALRLREGQSPAPPRLETLPLLRGLGLASLVLLVSGACLILFRLAARGFRGRTTSLLPEAEPRPARLPGAALLAEAEGAAAQGDYGGALALLHAASLDLLARKGLVPLDPCLTSGDVGRRLPSGLGTAFRALARRSEASRFGRHRADEGDYEAARRAYAQLEGEGA